MLSLQTAVFMFLPTISFYGHKDKNLYLSSMHWLAMTCAKFNITCPLLAIAFAVWIISDLFYKKEIKIVKNSVLNLNDTKIEATFGVKDLWCF